MNVLQKVHCLVVGMLVATMATNMMAFFHSNEFWKMVSDDMRALWVAQAQTRATVVAHPGARSIVRITPLRPVPGSTPWMAERMLVHAQGQFGY